MKLLSTLIAWNVQLRDRDHSESSIGASGFSSALEKQQLAEHSDGQKRAQGQNSIRSF
jgi:hypothetical protein